MSLTCVSSGRQVLTHFPGKTVVTVSNSADCIILIFNFTTFILYCGTQEILFAIKFCHFLEILINILSFARFLQGNECLSPPYFPQFWSPQPKNIEPF